MAAPGVSLCFNNDGTLLACGLINGIVIVFNVITNSKNRGKLTILNQCALVKRRSSTFGSALTLPGSKRKPTRREKKIQNKSNGEICWVVPILKLVPETHHRIAIIDLPVCMLSYRSPRHTLKLHSHH